MLLMTEKDIECNRIKVQQLVMSLVRVGEKIKLTLSNEILWHFIKAPFDYCSWVVWFC